MDRPETWEGIGGVDRVFDADLDPEGRLRGFSFDTVAAGRKYVGAARTRERVEGQRIAWDISNSEVKGSIVVDLEPAGLGTAVAVTLQVESVGLMSSMFFPVIAAAIGNGLPSSVDDFAAGFAG